MEAPRLAMEVPRHQAPVVPDDQEAAVVEELPRGEPARRIVEGHLEAGRGGGGLTDGRAKQRPALGHQTPEGIARGLERDPLPEHLVSVAHRRDDVARVSAAPAIRPSPGSAITPQSTAPHSADRARCRQVKPSVVSSVRRHAGEEVPAKGQTAPDA